MQTDDQSETAAILPRFRDFLESRRISRAKVSVYLGLHPNTFGRLNDGSWHPRLDTVLKIERFLREFASRPFVASGRGWTLAYSGSERTWLIERRGAATLGPFADPDTAIAAACALHDGAHTVN